MRQNRRAFLRSAAVTGGAIAVRNLTGRAQRNEGTEPDADESNLASVAGQSVRRNFLSPPKKYRPLVRWWWPGNDVRNSELSREIDVLDKVGFGGAEIRPSSKASTKDLFEARRQQMNRYASPSFFRNVAVAAEGAQKRAFIRIPIPIWLRSLEKSPSRHRPSTLVVDSQENCVRMRNFHIHEGNCSRLEILCHFRSDTFIRLKFDGEIDSPTHQSLSILDRYLNTVAILNLNQIHRPRSHFSRKRMEKACLCWPSTFSIGGRLPPPCICQYNSSPGKTLTSFIHTIVRLISTSMAPDPKILLERSSAQSFGQRHDLALLVPLFCLAFSPAFPVVTRR